MAGDRERRVFPRTSVPLRFRPARGLLNWPARPVENASIGGLRVFTDDQLAVGWRVELELLPADGEAMVLDAEVVWTEELPAGAPARYDVGVRFLRCEGAEAERLARLLDGAPAAAEQAGP